jgi:hypothetical protein
MQSSVFISAISVQSSVFMMNARPRCNNSWPLCGRALVAEREESEVRAAEALLRTHVRARAAALALAQAQQERWAAALAAAPDAPPPPMSLVYWVAVPKALRARRPNMPAHPHRHASTAEGLTHARRAAW